MSINREQLKKLVARFALGYPAWTLLFYSVKVLPVGLSQTIQNLTPFLTLIFAYLILSEVLKRLEIVNMLASFLGVLLIVGVSDRPDQSGMGTNYTDLDYALAVTANVGSCIMISLVNVLIRSLKGLHYAVTCGF